MALRAQTASITLRRAGLCFAILAMSGMTPLSGAAEPPAKHACVEAGDNCIKNIGDSVACRAAQASCLAMSQAINPDGASLDPNTVPTRPPELGEMPPFSPDGEAPGDSRDNVARAGAAQAEDLVVSRLRGEVKRTSITRHPKHGLVWRADVVTPFEGAPYAQRVICKDGVFVLTPMKSVDGDIKPLP
jgi:hypothetical protein